MQFRHSLTRCSAAAAVVLLGLAPGLAAAAASSSTIGVATGANLEGISVYDTADVLNDEKIKNALSSIDFNEPTKVAVFSAKANTPTTSTAKHSRSQGRSILNGSRKMPRTTATIGPTDTSSSHSRLRDTATARSEPTSAKTARFQRARWNPSTRQDMRTSTSRAGPTA